MSSEHVVVPRELFDDLFHGLRAQVGMKGDGCWTDKSDMLVAEAILSAESPEMVPMSAVQSVNDYVDIVIRSHESGDSHHLKGAMLMLKTRLHAFNAKFKV